MRVCADPGPRARSDRRGRQRRDGPLHRLKTCLLARK